MPFRQIANIEDTRRSTILELLLLALLCLVQLQPAHAQAGGSQELEEIAAPKKKKRPIAAHVRYVIETSCAKPRDGNPNDIITLSSADAVSVTLLGTLGQMDSPRTIGKAADCRNQCSFLDAYPDSGNDWRAVGRQRQNDNSQKWLLKRAGTDQANVYTLQQMLNMQYLDAYTAYSDGWQAVTRGWQNDDSQRWIIEPVENSNSTDGNDGPLNGLYTIRQVQTKLFLDAHIAREDNKVVMRQDQNDDSQQWFIEPVADETDIYELAQKGSCLGKDTNRAQEIAMEYAPVQDLSKQTLEGRQSGLANYGPIMAIQLSKPGSDAWYFGPVTVRYQVLDGGKWKDEVVSNFTKEGWLHNAAVGSSPAQAQVNLWEDGLGESAKHPFKKVVKETWQVIDNRHGQEPFSEKITETVTIRAEEWQQYNSEMENTLEVELEARFREEVKADASFGVGAESTSTLDLRTELRNRFRVEQRDETGSRNSRETRVERTVDINVPVGTLLLKHVIFTASGDTDFYHVGGKLLPIPAGSPDVTMSVERIAYEESANSGRLKLIQSQKDEIDNSTVSGLGEGISDFHKGIICQILGESGCRSIK